MAKICYQSELSWMMESLASYYFLLFSKFFFIYRRPQLGDVKAQLKASDVANLRTQKSLLESLAKEYEARVIRLKKILSAKRGYLKALQMDIQKYQKKNEDFIEKLNDKFEKHDSLVKIILPDKVDIDEVEWKDKDMELNEIN